MISENIRPLAIGIIWRNEEMLVHEIEDPTTGEIFYRPVGGGVEFGETSDEALVREFREELAIEIENLQLVGTIENLFTFNEQQCHQIEFIYTVGFVDDSLYSKDHMVGEDGGVNDKTITYRTNWMSLDEFGSTGERLVPDGLIDLLTDQKTDQKGVHTISDPVEYRN
jgi:ADP-ribose pyrophosphatase YjhB (NUDIX family)